MIADDCSTNKRYKDCSGDECHVGGFQGSEEPKYGCLVTISVDNFFGCSLGSCENVAKWVELTITKQNIVTRHRLCLQMQSRKARELLLKESKSKTPFPPRLLKWKKTQMDKSRM